MRTAGVLFDLFGTLVSPFRRREHTQVIRECSDLLAIDFDDCHRRWAELLPQRVRGDFASVADCFAYIVRQAGSQATPDALARAETAYEHFTLPSLEPIVGTLEVLAHLQASGLRLGVVSNCGPSDKELSGAAQCGLEVVLIAVDLSNTYDPQRPDVDHWSGPTIRALAELPGLLTN